MGRKRAQMDVTLKLLLDNGTVKPGNGVLHVSTRDQTRHADLLEDGMITFEGTTPCTGDFAEIGSGVVCRCASPFVVQLCGGGHSLLWRRGTQDGKRLASGQLPWTVIPRSGCVAEVSV